MDNIIHHDDDHVIIIDIGLADNFEPKIGCTSDLWGFGDGFRVTGVRRVCLTYNKYFRLSGANDARIRFGGP